MAACVEASAREELVVVALDIDALDCVDELTGIGRNTAAASVSLLNMACRRALGEQPSGRHGFSAQHPMNGGTE